MSVAAVLDLLRAHGGRITTARRVLLDTLFASQVHRSAETLAEEVRSIAPEVHLATIYRNLEELEQLGVIVHTHLGHGPAVYHLAEDAHGHLICEQCSAVFEAGDEMFAELRALASDWYGFDVDIRHFGVLGRCAQCLTRAQHTDRASASPENVHDS